MNINPSRYLELSIPKRKSEARQAFDVLLEVTCAFVSGKSHPLYNERMGRPFNQPICEKDVQDTQAALDANLSGYLVVLDFLKKVKQENELKLN